MPVRKAQRLCPDLIVLPPNPKLYARASRALHEILRVFAPTIEPKGYGHAFLDLTGTSRLFGPPQDVAARIRREVSARLRFPISVGIAMNKLVSQAAIRADRRIGGPSDGWIKGSGNELLYVPAGNEREFLAPHPLDVLPELDTGSFSMPTSEPGWTIINSSSSAKSRLSRKVRSAPSLAAMAKYSGPAPAASTRVRCCRRSNNPSFTSRMP